MANNIELARGHLFHASSTPGVVATVAPSNDHTDGTWSVSDIYEREGFMNVADGTMFSRDANGIIQIPTVVGYDGNTPSFDINLPASFGATSRFRMFNSSVPGPVGFDINAINPWTATAYSSELSMSTTGKLFMNGTDGIHQSQLEYSDRVYLAFDSPGLSSSLKFDDAIVWLKSETVPTILNQLTLDNTFEVATLQSRGAIYNTLVQMSGTGGYSALEAFSFGGDHKQKLILDDQAGTVNLRSYNNVGGAAAVLVDAVGDPSTPITAALEATANFVYAAVDLRVESAKAHVNVRQLYTFANNAAALAGSLVAGDLYTVTGSDPRQIAIVF